MRRGTGTITASDQVVFTEWDPTASSDMQALLDVFDTNHDGKLDAGDTGFNSFELMVTNADGTAADVTLAYHENGDAVKQTITKNADGSTTIDNQKYNRAATSCGAGRCFILHADQAASSKRYGKSTVGMR